MMTGTKKKTLLCAALATGCALFASYASAASVTIQTETGTAMETEFGIRADTGTRGHDLAGAEVTATFTAGGPVTLTWQSFDGFTTGGVNGDRWSFFLDGDDTVDVVSAGRIMTGFTIDLTNSISFTAATGVDPAISNGATLFDISREEIVGSTPGSGRGHPFAVTPGSGLVGSIAVTYSGAVNLVGSAPAGDLFTTMTVDLTGLSGGGLNGTLSYTSDTDTLRVAGDLNPVAVSTIPLPAGLPLLLAGMGALAVIRRKA